MKKVEENNKIVENINWMQVLAFGNPVDKVDKKTHVSKSSRVFEVMP